MLFRVWALVGWSVFHRDTVQNVNRFSDECGTYFGVKQSRI